MCGACVYPNLACVHTCVFLSTGGRLLCVSVSLGVFLVSVGVVRVCAHVRCVHTRVHMLCVSAPCVHGVCRVVCMVHGCTPLHTCACLYMVPGHARVCTQHTCAPTGAWGPSDGQGGRLSGDMAMAPGPRSDSDTRPSMTRGSLPNQ